MMVDTKEDKKLVQVKIPLLTKTSRTSMYVESTDEKNVEQLQSDFDEAIFLAKMMGYVFGSETRLKENKEGGASFHKFEFVFKSGSSWLFSFSFICREDQDKKVLNHIELMPYGAGEGTSYDQSGIVAKIRNSMLKMKNQNNNPNIIATDMKGTYIRTTSIQEHLAIVNALKESL